MDVYKNCDIARLVDNRGRRLGAQLTYPDGDTKSISMSDLAQLGDYLRQRGLSLNNAVITVDGRIYPKANQKVSSIEVKLPMPRTTRHDPVQIEQAQLNRQGISYAPKRDNVLRYPKEYYNATLNRLGSIVDAGLVTARHLGVYAGVTSVVETDNNRHSHQLEVTITSEDFKDFTDLVTIQVYLDGQVKVVDQGNLAKGTYPSYVVWCKSSDDLAHILIYFARLSGKSIVCDEERIKVILRESEHEKRIDKLKVNSPYVYPRRPLTRTLSDHIYNFDQLEQALNKEFFGVYTFTWDIKESRAVLSVTMYDSNKQYNIVRGQRETIQAELEGRDSIPMVVSGVYDDPIVPNLLELRLTLHQMTNRTYAASLDHRVLVGNQRWIQLAEHRQLDYISDICTAVQFLVEEQLQHGFIRESINVLAITKEGNKIKYLTTHSPKPITSDELDSLSKTSVINGVSFVPSSDGTPVILTGLNRELKPIPKYAVKEGIPYVSLLFNYHDKTADKSYTITTAIPWTDYTRLTTTVRREQVELKRPQELVGDLLIHPAVQVNSLRPIAKQLLGYLPYDTTPKQAVEFAVGFLKSQFSYSPIKDLVSSYNTPLEMLLDTKGCCLDLSVLSALLLKLMGYDSAVILRYAPELNTRYHAVSGVRIDKSSRDTRIHPAVLNGESTSPRVVTLDGYTTIELSAGLHDPVGYASYWGTRDQGTHAVEPENSAGEKSQIAVVSFNKSTIRTEDVTLARLGGVTSYTDKIWREVLLWFKPNAPEPTR